MRLCQMLLHLALQILIFFHRVVLGLLAEGAEDDVHAFLDAIHERLGDYVRNAEAVTSPATGEFAGFAIRY